MRREAYVETHVQGSIRQRCMRREAYVRGACAGKHTSEMHAQGRIRQRRMRREAYVRDACAGTHPEGILGECRMLKVGQNHIQMINTTVCMVTLLLNIPWIYHF
jgi:hypothetical protein